MADITELKSMKAPPQAVMRIYELFLILFNVQSADGVVKEGLKLMRDGPAFIKRLRDYDATTLTVQRLTACNTILANPDLTYETCKKSSHAASNLYVWIWNVCKIRSMILGVRTAKDLRGSV